MNKKMKIFANRRNIWKKIVIIFSLIFSMSFVEPAPVRAEGLGGTLMEPVCDLLVGLGDGFMNVTHHILAGQETTLIRVNLNDGFLDIARVAVTVLAFVAVVAAAAIITGGAAIAIGAVTGALAAQGAATIAASAILANIVPIAVLGTYFGVKAYSTDAFDNELDLPMYSISPERIFSNTVPLFDVNFFNPNSAPFKYEWIHKTTIEEKANAYWSGESVGGKESRIHRDFKESANPLSSNDNINTIINNGDSKDITSELAFKSATSAKEFTYNGKKYIYWKATNPYSHEQTEGWYVEKTEEEKAAEESSDDIAQGEGEKHSISYELANTVKLWYSIIRTIAIVGMMSVLVYIGIRILLSSTAEQKSKYKELLGDWLIGMVLLFTMQYIMVFANIAVDHLTDLLKNINPMGQTALIPDDKGKVEEELKNYEIGITTDQKDITIDKNNNISADSKVVFKKTETGDDGSAHTYIEWNTDLMGQLRIALQAHKDDNEAYIGYTIMYIVMVIYTGIFCYTYIKRVIYMAFLTIISPLVALTYPIDKVNDGSAQGFNYWFKEYIFNLLLQPVHLLIYTILVSTAIKFAAENIIYSLVALGFITQAEKIVRAMFNFSKATTPGVFSGPAGAAMAMTGMRWLMGHGPKGPMGGGKPSGASGGGSDSNNGGKLRTKDDKNSFKDSDNRSVLIGSGSGLGESSGGQGASTSVINNIGESVDGTSGNEPGSISFLERMRDAEFEETPYIPDNEQLQMWDNDARYENNDSGMTYSDDEYLQILRESGASDEEIAQIMGEPSGSMIQDNTGQIEIETENGTELENDTIHQTDDLDNIHSQDSIPEDEISTQQDNSLEDNANKNGIISKIANSKPVKFAGAASSAYAEGMKEKIVEGLKNAKPGRTIGKAMGGALGAAAFGTAGIAFGVASGDLKSVVTDGVAGVAGGYKLGSGAVNAAGSVLSVDGFGDEFSKKYYGEEEFARRNRKAKATSKANVDKVMEKYDKKSRKEAEKKAIALSDYWKYDDKLEFDQIIKLDKAKDNIGLSSESKDKEKIIVQANQDINKYGIANIKGDKDRAETAKQFNLDHPELGLSDEQALAYIDRLRHISNKIND